MDEGKIALLGLSHQSESVVFLGKTPSYDARKKELTAEFTAADVSDFEKLETWRNSRQQLTYQGFVKNGDGNCVGCIVIIERPNPTSNIYRLKSISTPTFQNIQTCSATGL